MVDWEEFYGTFRKPDFIPGYEILNHLGGGAFGEVYKARKSSIGKAYAVKFLKLEDHSGNEAVERELEQVRLFASIDHPNLVTIEDMGVVSGVPYLLMGYAGEDTLARHLKTRDLDRESALRTFVQVCRGVLALHDRRLAHFDLKPGNVFLKGEVARVGDYGLAKLLTEGRQTLSFGRGTPHYMAPEMLKNRADHRADIYSLGVILFESLVFRLPYEPPGGYGMIVRETDAPPDFPSDFPPSLRPVVERCLRLDPADRYDSVHEILEEMGQTARQGDSVRLRASELSAAAAPRVRGTTAPLPPAKSTVPPRTVDELPTRAKSADEERKPAVPESAPDSRSRAEDLRQAAAELARGAMGVAIGVWDGVRERVSGTVPPPGPPAGAAGPAAAPTPSDPAEEAPEVGSDVVSVSTLDEASAPAASDDAGAPVTRYLPRGGAPPESSPEPAALAPPAPRKRPRETPFGTVPVPPASEGGLMGTVTASAVLGAEIMGSLLSGPVMVGFRSTGNFIDRAVRGVPGIVGSGIRFLLFLLLMVLLGGVLAFLSMLAVSLDV